VIFPGEVCKAAGVYRVTHWQHRFAHDISIEAGTTFPACKICGTRVCFDEVSTLRGDSRVVPVLEHTDFREVERRQARRQNA
jgi:hypothetical protein